MLSVHPKTGGAAVGVALGSLIVAVLNSIHGVHLTDQAAAAIPSFLSLIGAWIVPAPETPAPPALPAPPVAVAPVVVPPAPVQPVLPAQ